MSGARKGRKVAIHCVFPMMCGSGGSKSRLAKAAGAEPAGQMRDEKLHAFVARSTFVSKKATNTSRSDRFWRLRCQKSARRCGAKHISKLNRTKHTTFSARLDVERVHAVKLPSIMLILMMMMMMMMMVVVVVVEVLVMCG